ncbi:hypothetical protein FAA97_19485 [Peteryoungia ipomoeae]|uniref:Propionyl-coenzyme A carboxylase alpha polypeptide n=1 Tax=Peteryoungia ipomoeae TaxID=1210932 RepID=A0A4S8NS85_9HYPH|nr:hypothetical protein FAA97_19485 [Peteryoungia ipomoeae]
MMPAARTPPSALPGISPTRGENSATYPRCTTQQTATRRRASSALFSVVKARARGRCGGPLSPHVEEMPGRAEGGAARTVRRPHVH